VSHGQQTPGSVAAVLDGRLSYYSAALAVGWVMDWRKHLVPDEASCRNELAAALAAFVDYEEHKATWREVVAKVRAYGNARECASCARNFRPIVRKPGFSELLAFTSNLEPPA